MVINNPEENDYTLVRQANKDYIRQLIWTTEVGGKENTEHIQAYVRLQRQQRMSFIKKLFPRGHFKSITKDEYDLNTQTYTQKNDETTAGSHVNTINDPIPGVDSILRQVCEAIPDEHLECFQHTHAHTLAGGGHPRPCTCDYSDDIDWEIQLQMPCMKAHIKAIEREIILKNPRVAKLLVSPTYTKIKKEYFTEIFLGYMYTHEEDEEQVQEVSAVEVETAGSSEDEEQEDQASTSTADEGTDDGDIEDD